MSGTLGRRVRKSSACVIIFPAEMPEVIFRFTQKVSTENLSFKKWFLQSVSDIEWKMFGLASKIFRQCCQNVHSSCPEQHSEETFLWFFFHLLSMSKKLSLLSKNFGKVVKTALYGSYVIFWGKHALLLEKLIFSNGFWHWMEELRLNGKNVSAKLRKLRFQCR